MKFHPPSAEELRAIVDLAKKLEGRRLQNIEISDAFFMLGFYGHGDLTWLVMDLRPARTCLLIFSNENRPRHKPQKKPLQLFLNAHLLHRDLERVELDEEKGRVVELNFSEDSKAQSLRLTLIPQLLNVEACAYDKQIFLVKPKTLSSIHRQNTQDFLRSPEQIQKEWLASIPVAKEKSHPRDSAVAKKEKAIQKVREELDKKSSNSYRALGQILVASQSLDGPEEVRKLVDPKLSLAENIQMAFSHAKSLDLKRIRTHERLQQLEAELQKLINSKANVAHSPTGLAPHKIRSTLKTKTPPYQGRTLKLSDDLEFIVGRSAKDNLALLRRSRAWDLWIHLKDQPGSHGILFRPKNKKISDDLLRKASAFLIHNSGTKAKSLIGQRVDLLVAECRFVRPIKGDYLGQVNYHSARTFSVLIT
jgi:predicted ribosome quality control (RQC) complex YloA/Tae2 family protein